MNLFFSAGGIGSVRIRAHRVRFQVWVLGLEWREQWVLLSGCSWCENWFRIRDGLRDS